ncbi:hypothetical protein N2152v2_007071 [Parachlorella kessleri]
MAFRTPWLLLAIVPLLLPVPLGAEDGALPYVAAAELSGANIIPKPLDVNATGKVAVAIGATRAVYLLQVNDIIDFTMSHIHIGNSSQNGLPIVLLAPGTFLEKHDVHDVYSPALTGSVGFVASFNASGILPPTSDPFTLDDLKGAISDGNAYAVMHNITTPVGLIRGQLEELQPSVVLPWEH